MNKDLDDFAKYLIEHMAKVTGISEEFLMTPIPEQCSYYWKVIKNRECFRRIDSSRKGRDENEKNTDSR